MIPVQFGNNSKAQLSARTVFGLAHRHGAILRDGWKNILDCILQLYRAKLLPDLLVKVGGGGGGWGEGGGQIRGAVIYAGSTFPLFLDICTSFAKPCEYARRRQMSR